MLVDTGSEKHETSGNDVTISIHTLHKRGCESTGREKLPSPFKPCINGQQRFIYQQD